MNVVAILSEKGGAGKTTLSVHLATAAQLAGRASFILDLDPQGSAFSWAERRQAEQSLYESEARFKALHNASFGGISIHEKGIILP